MANMIIVHTVLYILLTSAISSEGFPSSNMDYEYSILIDAGSSGSRMFLYKWPSKQDLNDVIRDISVARDDNGQMVVHKLSPGFSSFANEPFKLKYYIKELIEYAINYIPKDKVSETRLFILATAGMRFLTDEQQEKIWFEVRKLVAKYFDKLYFKKDMAKTISGFEEGLYGWITVNYLANTLTKNPDQQIGMIDLGGGSMQIAFSTKNIQFIDNMKSIFKFNIGNNNFQVYSSTYLGYGVNSARQIYKASLVINQKASLVSQTMIIKDGCLNRGSVEPVMHEDFEEYDSFFNTNYSLQYADKIYVLEGSGSLSECVDNQKKIIGKDAKCEYGTCGMNGAYQPQLPSGRNNLFYGLSEFWYTTHDVSKREGYNYDLFYQDTLDYCSRNISEINFLTLKEMKSNSLDRSVYEELLEKKRNRCFSASWILVTLHDGFGFPKSYEKFKPVDYINNIEVQWSLGALLVLYPRFTNQNDTPESVIQPKRNSIDFAGAFKYMFLFLAFITAAYITKKFFLERFGWKYRKKEMIKYSNPNSPIDAKLLSNKY